MTVARTVLVTLATPSKSIDLVADGDVTLASLLRAVVSSPDTGFTVEGRRLAAIVLRSGDHERSFVIRSDQTLLGAGVVDGDVVLLHRPAPPAPPSSPPRNLT